jgi:hypothetical protein
MEHNVDPNTQDSKGNTELYLALISDWFYLTRLMPSARTDLGTSGQGLALSHPIHVSSAIVNSLIVRSIGYIARFSRPPSH